MTITLTITHEKRAVTTTDHYEPLRQNPSPLIAGITPTITAITVPTHYVCPPAFRRGQAGGWEESAALYVVDSKQLEERENKMTTTWSVNKNHEKSAWLRERFAEMSNWPAGCEHVAAGVTAFGYVIAPMWHGALVCLYCLPLAKLPRGSDADNTCDRCGEVSDSGVYTHFMAVNSFTLGYLGLCGACRDKEAT